MALGPLTLEELKTEAQTRGHLVIRPDGETTWRHLRDWKGHSAGASYYLIGSRVLAREESEEQVHWYVLG
jgi:hypothetical protein